MASLGAGAIHASAVGVHSEHREAVIAFTVVALFQIGWGALALVRRSRLVAAVGAVGHLVIIGGWVMAKTNGISFVEGLDQSEDLQFADALAAGFAAVVVIATVATLLGVFKALSWSSTSRVLAGGFGTGIAVVSLFGMVSAGSHNHVGNHGGTETAATSHGAHESGSTAAGATEHQTPARAKGHSTDGGAHTAAVVPPK
ncbi:MAG: hypothetical protein WKF43_07915, partial [Acidimicrobiales bacterium]